MTHTTSRDISRRQLLDKAGIAAASVIAISLGGPAQAAPPSPDPVPLPNSLEPDRRARVTQQWEDVLLLEAMRYLGLSNTQIAVMLPLAKAVDERLAKLREQDEKKLAALEPIVQQNREALLAGKAGKHQEDALLYWHSLQQQRGQVEEEVIQYVTRRLARLLSRPQVLRAYRLARGEALPAPVASPALLDVSSGFVLNEVRKVRWRDAVVRQDLAKKYPLAVLDADAEAVRNEVSRRRVFNAAGEQVGDVEVTEEEKAVLWAQIEKEHLQRGWEHRWKDFSGRAAQAATEEELAAALYHFVWRTFLSTRLTRVLTERAGQHTDNE